MLWTVVAILLILWLLGFFGHVAVLGTTSLVHILLVISLVIVIVQLAQGRRPW